MFSAADLGDGSEDGVGIVGRRTSKPKFFFDDLDPAILPTRLPPANQSRGGFMTFLTKYHRHFHADLGLLQYFSSIRVWLDLENSIVAKGKRKLEVVHLVCEETGDQNYTLRRKTGGEKLRVQKYSPRLRKHTLHVEKKK